MKNDLAKIFYQPLYAVPNPLLVIVCFSGSSLGRLNALLENTPRNLAICWLLVQTDIKTKKINKKIIPDSLAIKVKELKSVCAFEAYECYYLPQGHTVDINHKVFHPSHNKENNNLEKILRSALKTYQHRTTVILLEGVHQTFEKSLMHVKREQGLIFIDASDKNPRLKCRRLKKIADSFVVAEKIGHVLARIMVSPFSFSHGRSLRNYSDDPEKNLAILVNLFKKKFNINLNQYGSIVLAASIERRMAFTESSSLYDYVQLAAKHDPELDSLRQKISIEVPRFFPYVLSDTVFAKTILERFTVEDEKNNELRIWVAGCGTGEEAYSLAILLDEVKKSLDYEKKIVILASDIDKNAINFSRQGLYEDKISLDMHSDRLNAYFTKKKNGYAIKPAIKKMVKFKCHDLFNDPPYDDIDLVSCWKNLRIFQPRVQKKILSSFYFSLRESRYLLLSPSDDLADLQSHFQPSEKIEGLYIKTSRQGIPIGSLPPSQPSRKTRPVKLDEDAIKLDEKVKTNESQKPSSNEPEEASASAGSLENEDLVKRIALLLEENHTLKQSNACLVALKDELYKINAEYLDKCQIGQQPGRLEIALLESGVALMILDQHLTLRQITPPLNELLNIGADQLGWEFKRWREKVTQAEIVEAIVRVQKEQCTVFSTQRLDSTYDLQMTITPLSSSVYPRGVLLLAIPIGLK